MPRPQGGKGLRLATNLISIPSPLLSNTMQESSVKITQEVVNNIAELAQLRVTGDDLADIAEGMKNILDLAEQLQSIDTSKVEPVSNPLDATQRLRADAITETDQSDLFQALAPQTKAGLYLVPRVLE